LARGLFTFAANNFVFSKCLLQFAKRWIDERLPVTFNDSAFAIHSANSLVPPPHFGFVDPAVPSDGVPKQSSILKPNEKARILFVTNTPHI